MIIRYHNPTSCNQIIGQCMRDNHNPHSIHCGESKHLPQITLLLGGWASCEKLWVWSLRSKLSKNHVKNHSKSSMIIIWRMFLVPLPGNEGNKGKTMRGVFNMSHRKHRNGFTTTDDTDGTDFIQMIALILSETFLSASIHHSSVTISAFIR